jgi:hypothetical protein
MQWHEWWIVIGDDSIGPVVGRLPLKVGDVPYSDATRQRNYRMWKMTFQAPPQVGVFRWRLRLVSDTYVGGEDYTRDLTVSQCSSITVLGNKFLWLFFVVVIFFFHLVES